MSELGKWTCGREMTVAVMRGKETICGRCHEKASRAEAAKIRVVGQVTLPLVDRGGTCVGYFVREWPAEHGNCCILSAGKRDRWCRNMSRENVEELGKRMPVLREGVLCDELEDGTVRVVDERVPLEWRQHSCSVHGFWEMVVPTATGC